MFSNDIFEVEILRWYVQIYDVYKLNNNNPLVPLIAPFVVADAQFATLKTKVTLPPMEFQPLEWVSTLTL